MLHSYEAASETRVETGRIAVVAHQLWLHLQAIDASLMLGGAWNAVVINALCCHRGRGASHGLEKPAVGLLRQLPLDVRRLISSLVLNERAIVLDTAS